MQIESIADHLDWVPLIAGWHWQEWGDIDPLGSLAQWTQGLYERTLRDQIPTTYVAVEQRQPVGSVTLVEHDMAIWLDLSPWLAGLYVQLQSRRRGVGSALVRHALQQVYYLGFPALYLYTHPARPFYEHLGWEVLEERSYHERPVTIMRFSLTSSVIPLQHTPA
ncbi:MAG TPA: GNAT family N-acetyltransferase [Ktedonobacterales bacterium]|jgi:GNAT superfamily N-acetyltransferase|nr:GNAT family N-acetyltransferase [Ktedonobacterales bacterium]